MVTSATKLEQLIYARDQVAMLKAIRVLNRIQDIYGLNFSAVSTESLRSQYPRLCKEALKSAYERSKNK